MEIRNGSRTYKSYNHILYSCQYHVIFCPKYRRSVLTDGIDVRLKELITEKQSEYQYEIIEMVVMPDYVHLILDVNPVIGIVDIVTKIKRYTSHIVKTEFPSIKSRLPTLWTRSKFISSVGAVDLEVINKYIMEQKSV